MAERKKKKPLNRKDREKIAEQQQQEILRIKMPRGDLEMLGIIVQLHGTNQIRVACNDGEERMCRIPGKMRKRVWMRQGDIVIIKLWYFQLSKADIAWRYTGVQAEHMRKKGLLDKLPV